MHDFDIRTGFNDTTILFCRRCGKSYRFIIYNQNYSEPVWEEVGFKDFKNHPVNPPGPSCDETAVVAVASNEKGKQ